MHFEFAHFYFVLIHLELKRYTSIHVRSLCSLENHTRFQTKMGKVFSDQKGPKHLPFPYIREYPLILTPLVIVRDRDKV